MLKSVTAEDSVCAPSGQPECEQTGNFLEKVPNSSENLGESMKLCILAESLGKIMFKEGCVCLAVII